MMEQDVYNSLRTAILRARRAGASEETIRQHVDGIVHNAFDTDPTCNLCGLSCTIGDAKSIREPSGLIDQSVCGGYPSTAGNGNGALDDTTSYRFSLCEFCIDWLFSQFMVPPTTSNYMDGSEAEPFRPAQQRVAQDEWRHYKQQFYDEFKRHNKAREDTINLSIVREIMNS
jgi:hypothetical protein